MDYNWVKPLRRVIWIKFEILQLKPLFGVLQIWLLVALKRLYKTCPLAPGNPELNKRVLFQKIQMKYVIL